MTTTADQATETTTIVPTTNAQTLLEMAISERMKEIHAAEEKQRQEHEAKVAEDRAQQQKWLEEALPADIRQTLGIELTPSDYDRGARRARFTFEGNTWSISRNRHDGLNIDGPNGCSNYSYRAQDNVAELLAALGTWRAREAKRQEEAQATTDETEESAAESPKTPHTVIDGDLYCVVLRESLSAYPTDLTTVSVIFGAIAYDGRAISLRRYTSQEQYDDEGRPIRLNTRFDLTNDELDALIAAREAYRAHLEAEKEVAENRADYDDVPF
jgi:hypothetical protein